MLFDGIKLVEGSEVQNLSVDSGTAFPSQPDVGELFYRTDAPNIGMYAYDGSNWNRFTQSNDDTTGQLPDVVTAGTYTQVTVTSKGLVDSGANPTTISGYGITDAQPLDNDLTAIAAISSTSGLLRKTGAAQWTLDTNAYITGNQTTTYTGDVTGSGTTAVTLTLEPSGVAAGAYGSATTVAVVTTDAKGRVTAATNTPIAIDASAVTSGTFANALIAQSNVTQFQGALSINESQIPDQGILARVADNESITGVWAFNQPVTGQTPTASGHLATKSYVDNVAQGLTAKDAVQVATTGANIVLSGLQTIDGYTTLQGDRVLVKDQTDGTQNGVYVADAGTWARAADMNGSPSNDIGPGDTVFVDGGTNNGNTSWVITNSTAIVLGTTVITWSLLSRLGGIIVQGGLTLSGNNLAVATASPSRIVVNANNIDLAQTGVAPSTYAQVTVDTYGRVSSGVVTLPWSKLTGTPTTISGYGITDAQPLNAELTAIANISTTGMLAVTGTGTATTRNITVSGTGLSVTNGDGVSGNPIISTNATANNTANAVVARDSAGNFTAGTVTAALNGNAATATTWQNPVSLTVSGDISGSIASINGSQNLTLGLTLPTVNANTGTFGTTTSYPIVSVNSKGLVTGVSTQTLVTSNIAEGTNLYFTTARAQNSISVSGSGLSYNGGVIASNATTANTANTLVYRDSSGNFSAGTITAALAGNANTATTATNVAGGAVGSIPYQSSSGVTLMLSAGTNSQVLISGTVPSWTNTPSLSGANFTSIPNGALVNSSVTIGSTNVALGNTITSIAGLSSVTATTFVGALTGIASGNLPLTGGTLTGALFLASDPTTSSQAATKAYVDNAIAGLTWKTAVQCATTANVTLSGLQTIDSYTTNSGDRVLVKNQSTPSQNGIYNAASGAWTRTADATTGTELVGAAVYVDNGSQVATGWVCSNTGTITVGTTSINFTQFSGNGAYTGGTGITLSGNSIINSGVVSAAAGAGISVSAGTGNITITNTGVTSLGAGTGVSVSASTGGVTITNTGVTALTAGSDITVSGSAGSVTVATNSTLNTVTTRGATTTNAITVGGVTSTAQVSSTNGFLATGAVPAAVASSVYLDIASTNAVLGSFGASTSAYTPIVISQKHSDGTSEQISTLMDASGNTTLFGSLTLGASPTITAPSGPITFGRPVILSGALISTDSTQGTDLKTFEVTNTSGILQISAFNDARSAFTSAYSIARGTTYNVASHTWYTSTTAGTPVQGAQLTTTGLTVANNLTSTGHIQKSVSASLAAAGTTQATGTAVVSDITVVGSGTGGVTLPSSVGTEFTVINATGSAVNVYPVSGAAIDANAANSAFSLPAGAKIMFIQTSTTQYYTLNATYA